ncbi:MAG: hypothetical protein A4E53_02331 [Pelotomaculum sp. PtaB.Bin104]|nr:MAG: hypothetical protein A4E53_02331 [Pelotomaculum sp. PtaB.Bin104]
MVRKNFKSATCAFIIGLLISVNAIAFAAEVESQWLMFNDSNGNWYSNQAKAIANINGVYGYTWMDSNNTLPAGYLGAKACLYNSAGSLIKSSSIKYTTTSIDWVSQATSYQIWSGTYYSKGVTYYFDGDGYIAEDTLKTPNLNY